MMLSKQDRIAFSKEIVAYRFESAKIDLAKLSIQAERDRVNNLDQGNKNLLDAKTYLVDGYQDELDRYDGVVRTKVTESDIQDAANMVVGNDLRPNDESNPPPSTAPFVWTKLKPFARTIAVGKLSNETYAAPIAAEQSKLVDALNYISTIETFTLIQRVTGQSCNATGTCSNPFYTDQTSCELNLHTWTPGPDSIANDPALQAAYNNLLSTVNDLKSYTLTTQSVILTDDPNTGRQAQNNTSISNITTFVAAIDTWLAVTPFNTAHGQTTCAGFNSYPPALLGSTRLQAAELAAIKSALQTRQAFVSSRVSEINTNLGTVTQNISTGSSTGSGLYFERWQMIELRLNMVGGTAVLLASLDAGLQGQTEMKERLDLAKTTYESVLTCSLLSAPTSGTRVVHVENPADFIVGDIVYLISDTQEELTRNIEAISGSALTLGQPIPAKYRPAEFARLYKDKI